MIGQETNGAAGMFKAFRTIPVILDIVKDMQELYPNAWMINFTNPAGMLTEAILRYTSLKKVIALCNVPINMANGFARLLQTEPERVTMEISGVNHHIFATDVFVDGQSRLEDILEIYQHISPEYAISMKNFATPPFSEGFIWGLHCIPCPYHSYYFFTKEQLEEELLKFQEGQVRGEVVKKVEDELFKLYETPALDEKPKQPEQRGGARYSDAACSLICSLYNDTGDIQYVNVRNNGAASNLPADSVVEIACIITGGGPKPIAIGELKPQINRTLQTVKTFERLVCESAVTE